MSTTAAASHLRCGPALARRLLHPPQAAAGVRRPLVVGSAAAASQQQPLSLMQGQGQGRVGAVRHSTIWRKVQEGIQGKQAEKEGAFRARFLCLLKPHGWVGGLDWLGLMTDALPCPVLSRVGGCCAEEQFQAELQRLASIDKYDLKAFKEAMDVRTVVCCV